MRYVSILLLLCLSAFAEIRAIPAARFVDGAIDPASPAWKTVPAVSLALQRTPLLYPTDAPATLDIPNVQVQLMRGTGKTLVRLEWADKSHDTAALPKAERSWQGEHLVKQSEATDRFSDACAVMVPAKPPADANPSLQMGDPAHPVKIFFWDSTRGAAVMDATGRETTKRSGASFPAQAAWSSGTWKVVLEIPEIAVGMPVAVAVWNGAQQDRDGRKYFSVWYRTE